MERRGASGCSAGVASSLSKAGSTGRATAESYCGGSIRSGRRYRYGNRSSTDCGFSGGGSQSS